MNPQERIAKIQVQFQNLSTVAAVLNKSSDELTSAVGVLDDALRKLNVGLSAWVKFDEWADEGGNEGVLEQIGYDKINGKWGIALRRVLWNSIREDDVDGPWLFNDATRELRLASVDKLPELIEELSKRASAATKQLQEKTEQTRKLAQAIAGAQGMRSAPPTNTIKTKNLSAVHVHKIKSLLRKRVPAVDDLLDHSSEWVLDKGDLKIYFPLDAAAQRDRFQQSGFAATSSAATEVLNTPINVLAFPELPVGWRRAGEQE